MNNRYIIFDVETPNSKNDRISAIGITVVENKKAVQGFYFLVNPECHFDAFNINLTGITPESVKDKPNFAELWQSIRPVMESGILIAHNAPFDMNVLAKCLRGYDIKWKKQAKYACTCAISRKEMPSLPNHKLNTLCDFLGIELLHHNAASDSAACAAILTTHLKNNVDIEKYIKTYDFAG